MRHALQIVLFKLKSQPCDVFAEKYDHLANQVSQMAVWPVRGFPIEIIDIISIYYFYGFSFIRKLRHKADFLKRSIPCVFLK